MAIYEHPSFHYHAAGHALSGEFYRPFKYLIEAQAGTCLPLAGGHGQAHVENFQIAQRVSMGKGYSHVSGSVDSAGKHTSQATVVVERLNVLDVLTADRVVARVTSERGPKDAEGHVITLGTKFENLRVSGYAVEVEFDHAFFLKHKTLAEMSKDLAVLKKSGRMAEESDGVILCSVVKSLKVASADVQVQGHVITVPHFGKIYVGEVLAERGNKKLTSLRMQLGSPDEASLTVAEASSNGRTWP